MFFHTDNIAAARIVKVGSNKEKLQFLANIIYNLCKVKGIFLKITWIARKLNGDADAVSKNIDYDDWEISENFFTFLNSLWGPFSIDLFADNSNTKCTRFCSKYFCPFSFKVDAFSFDWSGENSLMVPPIYLITKCIKHFLAAKPGTTGTLIIPFWPSTAFWTFLIRDNSSFKPFVKDCRYFANQLSLIRRGRFQGSLMGDEKLEIPILALKLQV